MKTLVIKRSPIKSDDSDGDAKNDGDIDAFCSAWNRALLNDVT